LLGSDCGRSTVYGIYWPVTIQEGRNAGLDKLWTSCTMIPTSGFEQLPARRCAESPDDLTFPVADVHALAGW
jgi:hypothetical protein